MCARLFTQLRDACVPPAGRAGLGRWLLLSSVWMAGAALAQPLPALMPLVQQHPRVLQAQSLMRSAEAEVELAAAGNSPRLSSSLGSTYTRNVNDSGQGHWLSPSLRGTLPLYDHGRNKAEVRGREFARDAQAVNVELERESLSQQLMGHYIDALTHQAAVRVLTEQAGKLDELVAKLTAVAALDAGRRFEVTQLQARRFSVLTLRDARRQQLSEAMEQIRLMLRVPDVQLHPLGDLKAQGLLPGSLETLRALLLKEHPSLRVARLEESTQEMSVEVASKWNRPRWALEMDLSSARNASGQFKPLSVVGVKLGSNMDLFDGGTGSATQMVQVQRLGAAQAKVEVQTRELTQALERLWLLMPLREQRMPLAQRQVEAANQMRQVAFEQFVAGRRPLTDLINFENEYFNAALQHAELAVQALATPWQLVAATGQLSKLNQPEAFKRMLSGS